MTRDITILDGGMGRELELMGAPFRQPEWSALAMMEAPGAVKAVHAAFIASGAAVIMTNSYALVPFHIGEKRFREQAEALAASAGKMARAAADEAPATVLVAGSIPPLFGSYRPDLYRPEQVASIAAPLIRRLSDHVDLWICETQSLIEEPVRVKSLIDSMDIPDRPFWVSFTLEDFMLTDAPVLRSGQPVADMVPAMVDIKADAILFNCSQPEVIGRAVSETRRCLAALGAGHIQIGAYANAFAPQLKEARANEELHDLRSDLTPQAYLDWARLWARDGATLIGGCCGIGPAHIALLAETLA